MLAPGDVFYYSVDPNWDVPPHPKIVVYVDSSDDIYFIKASTDRTWVEPLCRRFERPAPGSPIRTMVEIQPLAGNGLTAASYADCNTLFMESGAVTLSGTQPVGAVSKDVLDALGLGIICSPKHSPAIKALFIRVPTVPMPAP